MVYSKEKGVLVSFIGRNAFIKFVQKKDIDGTIEHIKAPSMIYVVTQSNVYQIVLEPKEIAGRIIRLAGSKEEKIKSNLSFFGPLPYEKRIVYLIKAAYKNDIPDTWDITTPKKSEAVTLRNGLKALLIKTISIDGLGMKLKMYEIKPSGSVKQRIDEKMFITPKLSKHILALSLTKFVISPNSPAVLFLIEKGGTDE